MERILIITVNVEKGEKRLLNITEYEVVELLKQLNDKLEIKLDVKVLKING